MSLELLMGVLSDSFLHDNKVSFQKSFCVLFINMSHQVEPLSVLNSLIIGSRVFQCEISNR